MAWCVDGIHAGSSYSEIFQSFDVNLRIVQMIQKELYYYNCDYEDSAVQKTHSDQKRTRIAEIYALFDNIHGKSVGSVSRSKGVPELFIW